MEKNDKHFEWEEILLFIDDKPNSFLLNNFINNSQNKTEIVKKLITERNECPSSYPTGGKIDKRQKKIFFLLESLEGKSGFHANLLIFHHFYSWAIPLIAILLSVILTFTLIYTSQSNSSEWFCSIVDGEKKCYRQQDIDAMQDKYRN